MSDLPRDIPDEVETITDNVDEPKVEPKPFNSTQYLAKCSMNVAKRNYDKGA